MKRITFVGNLDNGMGTINSYLKLLPEDLCKVPFNNNDSIRKQIDTLPYHFTLSAWDIKQKEKVINILSNINDSKFKILVNNIDILYGKENSYVLCFCIEKSDILYSIQKDIYDKIPSDKYNPDYFNFHITIHIDKDYDKIISMRDKLLKKFTPFEIEISELELYEIYPAKLIDTFKLDNNKLKMLK